MINIILRDNTDLSDIDKHDIVYDDGYTKPEEDEMITLISSVGAYYGTNIYPWENAILRLAEIVKAAAARKGR